MKSKVLLLVALLSAFSGVAQSVDWFETIGIPPYRSPFQPQSLSVDDSVVTIAGVNPSYIDQMYFYRSGDSLKVSYNGNYYNNSSGFVAQYTTDGRFKWARALGTSYGLYDKIAAATRNGNTYATAIIGESGMIGSDTTSLRNGSAILLVKYDKNGREVWRKFSAPFYTSYAVRVTKLVVDARENIFLVGERDYLPYRTVAFDSVSTRILDNQFVIRFDANGNAQKAYGLQEPDVWYEHSAIDLKVDNEGNAFLLVNVIAGNLDSPCSEQHTSTRIFRLDKSGSIQKVATFDCSDQLTPRSLGLAENGDFLVCGRYRGTVSIGSSIISPSIDCKKTMGFVLRMTANGTLAWFRISPNRNDFSNFYQLLAEKDGNWLVASYQVYGTDTPDSIYRYPGADLKYPDGRGRLVVRRLSPNGVQLDSVAYYIPYLNAGFNDILLAQNSQKTYIASNYTCYVDTISASSCSSRFFYSDYGGLNLFLAQMSDKVLQKHTLPTPSRNPSTFTVRPNPTAGNLYIQIERPLDSDAELTITNLSGQTVLAGALPKGQFIYSYSLHDLPNGMYIVRIAAKGEVWLTKLVKN